jgi:hypothetical protein
VVVLVALPLVLVALQGVAMVEVLLVRLQLRVPPIQVQVGHAFLHQLLVYFEAKQKQLTWVCHSYAKAESCRIQNPKIGE